MEPFNAGWLSILPPVLAVALALKTKEVYSSLLVGILTGTGIYAAGAGHGNVAVGAVEAAFKTMVSKFDLNIVMFCSLLGALVYVIALAGGTKAYGKWATSRIRGRRSALFSTSLLGGAIFIDDYFNCLTVGTVMRPVTDTYRISRAKLAYIIDSTAAPICIIAPISSWAAAVGSNLKSTKAFDNELGAFAATIPWNFYALLCIALVVVVTLMRLDFGPMRAAEARAAQGTDGTIQKNAQDDPLKFAANGTVWDMLLPILSLIAFATLALLHVGGYWGDDPKFHSLGAAFGNTEAGPALVMGSFGALLVALLLFAGRGLLSLKTFMDGVLRGVQAMVPANMILVLAWGISGVCRDLLQTPQFISTLVSPESVLAGALLPAAIFAIAGFLSFSTGTAWGTFGLLIPIVVPVAQAIDPAAGSPLIVISLSATLAGSVFGDHCSPISDTTVLSSAGAGCVHIEHVSTQLPYALLAAACALAGYLVAGATLSLPLSLGAAFGALALAVCLLRGKKPPQAGTEA